jgi:hypothetical protein
MNVPGFTLEAVGLVNEMLYAEGQKNPLLGECGQKKKREAMSQPRTPAQEAADRARSQAQTGRTQQSSSVRSEAAKKSAETRARCKGGGNPTTPSTATTA